MNKKYPCNLIQDLLPLYHDGICSEESRDAIDTHLSDCSVCQKYYTSMCESDKLVLDVPVSERECQKAASFQAVKKKMFKKQLLYAILPIFLLLLLSIAGIEILKNKTEVVMYEDNISVFMADGNLVGRLQGIQPSQVRIKRVDMEVNGQKETYLLFCAFDTKWAELTTSSNSFTEYTLCYSDKGADQIDAVYYFTEYYTDIENMGNTELQEIIDASELLWNSEN